MNNLSGIEAILDIFSGRPNPRWTLSDEQVNDLQARLRTLPEASPVAPPGLGYRGFLVTNPSNDDRLPGQLRAFASVVAITTAQATNYYQDANNIEEWLIEQARSREHGEVIDRFRRTDVQ